MNAPLSHLEPGLESAAAAYVRGFERFTRPPPGSLAHEVLLALQACARLSGLSLHAIAQRHLAALWQRHGVFVWLLPAWWTWRRIGHRSWVPPRAIQPATGL